MYGPESSIRVLALGAVFYGILLAYSSFYCQSYRQVLSSFPL